MTEISKSDVALLCKKLGKVVAAPGYSGRQHLAEDVWFQPTDALRQSGDALKALFARAALCELRIKSLKARLYCFHCLHCPACGRLHWLVRDNLSAPSAAEWVKMMPVDDLPPKAEGFGECPCGRKAALNYAS